MIFTLVTIHTKIQAILYIKMKLLYNTNDINFNFN